MKLKLEKEMIIYRLLPKPLGKAKELRISLRYQKEWKRGIYADIAPVDRSKGKDIIHKGGITILVKPLNRRMEKERERIFTVMEFLADGIAAFFSAGDREDDIESYIRNNV